MKRVSRTYNISYELSDSDWQRLAAVYQQLPDFRGYDDSGCPTWFGCEGDPIYVGASVEPSGLLVEGVLDDDDWQTWDSAFRAAASKALGFEVRDADE